MLIIRKEWEVLYSIGLASGYAITWGDTRIELGRTAPKYEVLVQSLFGFGNSSLNSNSYCQR